MKLRLNIGYRTFEANAEAGGWRWRRYHQLNILVRIFVYFSLLQAIDVDTMSRFCPLE